MLLLELFAGTRSIGKVAEQEGIKVISVENDPQFGCNMTMDIMDFDIKDFIDKYGVPDVIWASPPCTTFSIASCSHHRNKDYTPKTKEAELGNDLVMKTLQIIKEFYCLNPYLIWFIENPRGLLRKMDFMEYINHLRETVTYCQYGDNRMKPTDIWTNSTKWKPRPHCKNGDSCHTSAPRGSRTGTQGLKGAKERSIIPEQLCREIILSCK